jgi:hypothetical protein
MTRTRFALFVTFAVCLGGAGGVHAQQTLKAQPVSPQEPRVMVKPELMRPVMPNSCAAFIQDLWSWVNQKKGASAGDHRVGAKMAVVKIQSRGTTTYPWGHGAYAEGGFGWSGDTLVGRFKVLFSDRKSASGARFDAAKADIQDVTLHKDGRVEIMLRNWGNTLLPLHDLTCHPDGFLTGIRREGNGVSMVSFALRKEVITPGSHPAQSWP